MRQEKTAFRPIRNQVKAYTGTAGELAAAIGAGVKTVRLMATTLCHVKFGNTGMSAATTSDMPLPPNLPEYFNIEGGEQISVIQNAAGGNLYITEMG